MKVYILYSSKTERKALVEGVFCSLSALLTWLDAKIGDVEILGTHNQLKDESAGWFNNSSKDGLYYSYEAFNVIGGHSHKTNTIYFN